MKILVVLGAILGALTLAVVGLYKLAWRLAWLAVSALPVALAPWLLVQVNEHNWHGWSLLALVPVSLASVWAVGMRIDSDNDLTKINQRVSMLEAQNVQEVTALRMRRGAEVR